MRRVFALARQDLLSEARSKEIAPAMVLFALALVFLFTFALPPGAGRAPVPPPVAGAVAVRDMAGTFLWIAILFAAIIGFGRSAAEEKEDSRIDGLLLAPVDPAALFLGKLLANFTFLVILEAAALPFFIVFLDIDPTLLLPGVLPILLLANLGLADIGTLFGAASQHARARALILPLLSFPILLPIVLGASRLTSDLMLTGGFATEGRWFILLTVFDLVTLAIGMVTFEFVIQE
ncbi:MAG TPA: heme exporter protein CcmB [Actinomycetota bacterium]|nr:heme exporter protein CcmB [Actinomycetota bacterium]